MSGGIYRVRLWEEKFEGAKSKTYNNKSSCQMPSKHGLGYRRLIRSGKNGPALFGAWCAMIQILSRQDRPRLGFCTDDGTEDGKPYTPDDLEILTDIPAAIFREMLKICSSESVGWLDVMTPRIPHGYHTDTAVSPRYPLDSDSDLDLDSNLDSDSCAQRGCAKFKKPTVEQITKYCNERKNHIDPQQFFDHYESNGWRVGKASMKNWQAAIRTWEKNNEKRTATNRRIQPPLTDADREDIAALEEGIQHITLP